MFHPAEVRPETPRLVCVSRQRRFEIQEDFYFGPTGVRHLSGERLRRPYLHCLKLADGGAECHAFLRVVGGAVQRGLSDAERLGCDADSSTVQGLLRRSHTRKRDSGTEARGSHSFPDIIFQDFSRTFLAATETSYHMIH